jgi:hypothetical protein
MSRLGVAALALPLLLGAGACNTFKYVDMKVNFDQTVDDTSILTVMRCRILVTGADSDNFILYNCPPAVTATAPDPHNGPSFEFSTFASSGKLHFEFQGFQGLVDKPECMTLNGTQDVVVSSMTTIPASINVTKTTQPGCTAVSGAGGAGP